MIRSSTQQRVVLSRLLLVAFAVLAIGGESSADPSESTEISRIFEAAGPAVFRIQASQGHGAGFLVDSAGLIVTNSHVVSDASAYSVLIERDLRVPATLLVDDQIVDIAVLRVNPAAVEHVEPLRLHVDHAGSGPSPGDQAVAIGFPLSQDKVVTHGVVGRVEEGAIISDVDINPGNSGGPLLDIEGRVIGVNTFAQAPSPGLPGAGVSGTVSASKVAPIIVRAAHRLGETPPMIRLPTVPQFPFPKQTASSIPPEEVSADQYRLSWSCERSSGKKRYGPTSRQRPIKFTPFYAYAITPMRIYRQSILQNPEDRPEYDWQQFVSGHRKPEVKIVVFPKFVATGASAVATLMVGTPTTERKHAGSVGAITMMRGGEPVNSFREFVAPTGASIAGGVPVVDVGNYGYMSLPYEAFEPVGGAAGDGPVSVVIEDLVRPESKCHFKAERSLLERIWVDFEPYREAVRARSISLNLDREPGW